MTDEKQGKGKESCAAESKQQRWKITDARLPGRGIRRKIEKDVRQLEAVKVYESQNILFKPKAKHIYASPTQHYNGRYHIR